MRITTILSLLMASASVVAARADDWPQWLGPQRDSVWRETGIVEQFPSDGLKVKWRVPVELGYAGPAVAGGKVFVADYVKRSGEITNNPSKRDRLEGTERVLCLEAATGKTVWKHEHECSYNMSYPGGPRCTPSIDGDRVYTLGAEGHLFCLNVADGSVLWSKDFKKDYQAKTPIWGISAHPLVDGDFLYCVVGGPGSVAVAFDKLTGREVWKSLTAKEQGYCPPTMIQHGGKKQLLIWHAESLNSLDPLSGTPYWSVPLQPSYGMAIIAPKKLGSFLFASGMGNVGAMLQLDDQKPAAEVLWRGVSKTAFYSALATPLMEDGMMYGCDINSGALIGARIEDGERVWETTQPTTTGRRGRYCTAFLVKQGARCFLFNETGHLILAKLSPEGYEELGRFHVLEATNKTFGRPVVWSHPAFAEKCMFARNDKELVCVNLAAEQ
jgi:outer membrane protein assembly factor BamB